MNNVYKKIACVSLIFLQTATCSEIEHRSWLSNNYATVFIATATFGLGFLIKSWSSNKKIKALDRKLKEASKETQVPHFDNGYRTGKTAQNRFNNEDGDSIKKLEQEIINNKEVIQGLQANCSDLGEKILKLEKEKSFYRVKYENTSSTVDKMNELATTRNKKIDQLEKENSQLKLDITTLENQNKQLHEKNDNKKLNKELCLIEGKYNEIDAKNTTLMYNVSNLQSENNNLQKNLQSYEDINKNLSKENTKLKNKIEKLNVITNKIQDTLELLQKDTLRIVEENNSLKQEIGIKDSKIQSMKDFIAKLFSHERIHGYSPFRFKISSKDYGQTNESDCADLANEFLKVFEYNTVYKTQKHIQDNSYVFVKIEEVKN